MANRSQSKFKLRKSRAALYCAAIAPLVLAGCQSGGQQDLVVREMRMQEDQIYAMEDYLAQYQQLICKYRSENAALKRQLAEERSDSTLPAPLTRSRATPRTTPRTRPQTGPAIEVPPLQQENGTLQQPEVETPDVPPLNDTTEEQLKFRPVRPVSYMDTARATEAAPRKQVIGDVRLHGEVIANDDGGGPRLSVAIEPLDSAGQVTQYDGDLSLMLLVPSDDGSSQNLARWDFGPDDVQSAIEVTSGDAAIRFNLELPADTATDGETQLWTRLLPRGGTKLLAHADINLAEPGEFASETKLLPPTAVTVASNEKQPAAPVVQPTTPIDPARAAFETAGTSAEGVAAVNPLRQQAVVPAMYEEGQEADNEESHEERAGDSYAAQADMTDGGWSIARPGEPAGPSADSSAEWRATLETPPQAIGESIAARPKPDMSRARQASRTPPRRPRGWSSEREAESTSGATRTAAVASRPIWSSTR